MAHAYSNPISCQMSEEMPYSGNEGDDGNVKWGAEVEDSNKFSEMTFYAHKEHYVTQSSQTFS